MKTFLKKIIMTKRWHKRIWRNKKKTILLAVTVTQLYASVKTQNCTPKRVNFTVLERR